MTATTLRVDRNLEFLAAARWTARVGMVFFVVFLGVLSEVLYRVEDGTLEFRQTPASITPVIRTREMLDLGLVFKARTVIETIEQILRNLGEIPS